MTGVTSIKIGNHSQLVAAVPHLLGFTPSESFVVLGLTEGRVVITMRMDLDDVPGVNAFWKAASPLTDCDEHVVVLFSADPHQLIRWNDIISSLTLCGSPIMVHAGLALCTCGDCTPMPSTDLTVQATMALAGNAPLPSREQAIALLDPDWLTAPLLAKATAQDWRTALDAQSDPHAQPLDDDTVALLLSSLRDIQLRDRVLRALGEAPREMLLHLARKAQGTPAAPAMLCITGLALYMDGNAILARTCAERALAVRPDYSLAQLIIMLLGEGVPPTAIREMTTTTDIEPL